MGRGIVYLKGRIGHEGHLGSLEDRIKVLEEALQEIARPARGGIEANDSDEDWIDYLVQKCNKYQALARGALEHE